MTDTMELNRRIEASNVSKEGIASKLGIALSSLNNKISNRTEFKASEIDALVGILHLDRPTMIRIFFAKKVSSCDTKEMIDA